MTLESCSERWLISDYRLYLAASFRRLASTQRDCNSHPSFEGTVLVSGDDSIMQRTSTQSFRGKISVRSLLMLKTSTVGYQIGKNIPLNKISSNDVSFT